MLTDPIYQGRAFAENVVYRGFALRAAYERSFRSIPMTTVGESTMVGDHHVLVGIGKSYRVTQQIRGTTLLLYRTGDIEQPLPLSRWNLRTGFYLNW